MKELLLEVLNKGPMERNLLLDAVAQQAGVQADSVRRRLSELVLEGRVEVKQGVRESMSYQLSTEYSPLPTDHPQQLDWQRKFHVQDRTAAS